MEIVAIISVIIYLYTLSCLFREFFLVNHKTVLLEVHKKVHLSILINLSLMYFFIPYWLYNRKGLPVGYSLNKIDEDFVLILFFMTLSILTITRYIRKIRTDESLVLEPKKDFKKSMTFGFYDNYEFKQIARKFIKKHRDLGEEIEEIEDSKLDVEPFKFLKNGEIHKFSKKTWLEKIGDIVEHNYYYHFSCLIVFYMHEHLKFAEELTAIDYEIEIYLKKDGKKDLEKIIVPIGKTFKIPKGVKHAVIVAKKGKIGLKWK